MSVQYREFPGDWAQDELTKFIDFSNGNVVATFVQNEDEYLHVSEIDNIYLAIVRALLNPHGMIEAVLLMRAHAAYRATALLGMAGMNPEAFVQMRGCLECALYAFHMNSNPGLDESWLRRHEGDAALRTVRREFSFSRIIATLESKDARNAKVAHELYERTIDFGAHPNERAVTANLDMHDRNGGRSIQQIYLGGGTLPQKHALKSAAQVGLCGLYIFRLIFRERFDILGLTEQMDRHRDAL